MASKRSLSFFEMAERSGWPLSDPRILDLVLTYQCNARCSFCYNPDVVRDTAGPMDLKRAAAVLYESHRKKGSWMVAFSGGDVTVHPEFPAIARLARKIGYSCVSLDSNGIRLSDPKYVKELVDAGVNEFGLSMHGASPETHDRLVGVPGAWQRGQEALKNLQKYPVHIKVNFLLNRRNFRELPLVADRLIRLHGESHLCVSFPHYRGMMWKHRKSLAVSFKDVVGPALETLAVYRKARVPIENRMFINFPPCVLPGYEDLLSDWDCAGEGDDHLVIPEGKVGRVVEMVSKQREKAPNCARCLYAPNCMGFEIEYRKIFGTADFVPVTKRPRPIMSRPKSAAGRAC